VEPVRPDTRRRNPQEAYRANAPLSAVAWHLDEVFVEVNGMLCYLWRAVDPEGEVLEVVVTARRDKAAALKLLKRIMRSMASHALSSLTGFALTCSPHTLLRLGSGSCRSLILGQGRDWWNPLRSRGLAGR
jgi:hypothetical protein